MIFKRENFLGSDFFWHGVDSIGAIAQFTAGFTPVPKKLFNSKYDYDLVDAYLAGLGSLTNSYLSPEYQEHINRSLNQYETIVEEAKRGIYIFEENERETNYKLIALPTSELKIVELPQNIQDYLNQFVFTDIIFKKIKALSVIKYFDCE